jgi:hypothetical protein
MQEPFQLIHDPSPRPVPRYTGPQELSTSLGCNEAEETAAWNQEGKISKGTKQSTGYTLQKST